MLVSGVSKKMNTTEISDDSAIRAANTIYAQPLFLPKLSERADKPTNRRIEKSISGKTAKRRYRISRVTELSGTSAASIISEIVSSFRSRIKNTFKMLHKPNTITPRPLSASRF